MRLRKAAVALIAVSLAGIVQANSSEKHFANQDAEISPQARAAAAKPVSWRAATEPDPVAVQLLTLNDFHGQLGPGRRVANRPVGSIPVLTAYLKQAMLEQPASLIIHAGDHVGATPPNSALLQDEPSISFLNLLANSHCRYEFKFSTACNMVGTPGNHEFDEGKAEMLRLLNGGNHANGPFLESPWRGARLPYISANVVDIAAKRTLLPAHLVKRVNGVRIGVIGAVLEGTPTIVTPSGVAGLRFTNEAAAINKEVEYLRRQGIRSFVVTIHQGGSQTAYEGATDPAAGPVSGAIVEIVRQLHDDVDVVVSGHAHGFTNALLPNRNGKPILVTQAFSSGTAYGDIDLEIDRVSGDVLSKTARIVTTWADAGPGLTPDAEAAALLAAADEKVAPIVNELVAVAGATLTRTTTLAGESALGNLIADAQRASMNTEFAFMNPGGIRADLQLGEVTWGELFAVQPFGNDVVKLELTGAQIITLLQQQWSDPNRTRILQISGLRYRYDLSQPVSQRIVSVEKTDGTPLDLTASYVVAVNSFLADGGDGFVVLREGRNKVVGPVDLQALIDYVRALPQPFTAAIENRIQLN